MEGERRRSKPHNDTAAQNGLFRRVILTERTQTTTHPPMKKEELDEK